MNANAIKHSQKQSYEHVSETIDETKFRLWLSLREKAEIESI